MLAANRALGGRLYGSREYRGGTVSNRLLDEDDYPRSDGVFLHEGDGSGGTVHGDSSPSGDAFGGARHADDGRDTKLAGDDGSVRHRHPPISITNPRP